MPESLLARRLKLGKFLGIGLYVHWSFALLILYVVFALRGEGAAAIAFAISELLGVFLCVTLHEYGHAMAARAFGIGTADITLLPIGGVARLHRMPRIPWQELIVAVAGPAVNIVIAAVLLLCFYLFLDDSLFSVLAAWFQTVYSGATMDAEMVQAVNELDVSPTLTGFALLMLVVNVVLVLFNMIPAFPMDGGRVFRSLMAMVLDYRKATWVASRVGLVCAFLMALFALNIDPANPIPVLIAVFIGYAGISEARHVDVMESVRGLTVGQVMIRSDHSLPMDTPLSEIIHQWRSLPASALPVVSIVGTVVGTLSLREVSDAIERKIDPSTTAGQLVNHDVAVGTIRAPDLLENVLMQLGKSNRQIPVVDEGGQLVGLLDLDSMLVRRALSKHSHQDIPEAALVHFDRVT